jgi:hypothetical protein
VKPARPPILHPAGRPSGTFAGSPAGCIGVLRRDGTHADQVDGILADVNARNQQAPFAFFPA